jgi:hypothetical protein
MIIEKELAVIKDRLDLLTVQMDKVLFLLEKQVEVVVEAAVERYCANCKWDSRLMRDCRLAGCDVIDMPKWEAKE